jgi:hypothetical protein
MLLQQSCEEAGPIWLQAIVLEEASQVIESIKSTGEIRTSPKWALAIWRQATSMPFNVDIYPEQTPDLVGSHPPAHPLYIWHLVLASEQTFFRVAVSP